MKNFTNNFKQFTSRLSARWLIMALMLLVGIGELFAATTVYFVNKPKWSQVNVHQWNGGTESTWPGPKATKENYQVNGYDVYVANIGDNKKFIFSNNGNSQTANLEISNGTWYYDGKQYSSKEAIEGAINNSHNTHTSITKFSVSSSDVIYFDATGTGWTTCYMYIGHNNYSKRFAMTRVAGTKNLWKGTSFGSWSDAQAWYFSSEDWNDIANGKNECILCKACYHTENTFLMPYKSDFTNNAIYKASANNQMYATSECCKNAWSWSSTVNTYSSSLSVSITNKVGTNNTANAGTVTVKKWTNAGSAYSTSFLSTSAATGSETTGYLTAVRITLTASTGYELENLTVGGTDVTSTYKTNGYYDKEITAATAIVATWKKSCTNPTISNIAIDKASVCSGSNAKITVTATGATSYQLYTVSGSTYTKSGNAQASNVFTVSAAGTYAVKALNGTCESGYSATKTLTVLNPTISNIVIDKVSVCSGSNAKITVTATGATSYQLYTVNGSTYTKSGNAQASNVFTVSTAGTYAVKALNGTCESGYSATKTLTVNDKPATPTLTPESIVLTSGSATLTVSNPVLGATYTLYKDGESTGETGTQFTITSQGVYKVLGSNDCGNSSFSAGVLACAKIDAPTFEAKSMTICEGEPFDLPTPNNLKDGEECAWSISGRPTPGHQSGISITTTYQAVKSNDIGCKSDVTEFVVNVIKTPTISGATYTQPGKSNAITLTAANGILADWSVDNSGDLSHTSKSNTTEFSAEANGIYTITASNGTCTATHVVTVSDAFYVYMRQPKKGETAYNNFYYPTQNPTQGGDLFYKEYASIPPAEGYTDYNKGGVAHDIIFTDCDGYVWYGFKASDKLIDGTNYFTVHAPNKNGYDGWFTHTDITKPGKMTGDIYYIMGTEGNGNSGWKIEEASAPYSGPVVHASGNDFSFNRNNFADFVALYVTDCSGKEIDYYQWQYSQTENGKYDDYSSVCTYVGKKSEQGDAGKTNNIRPNVAGWYRCTATYKDGSSLTSAAKQVTATSGTSYSFTSDLPIIMVNTNGYGFPSCDGLSGTASKNADVLKAKISVDVKIYEDETLVYDRKARMNYRGSSSLNFVKKSYAFCPGKADCVEDKGRVDYVKTEKLNMLGVGSAVDKDWVLYAAAADPSIMRNRLMFDTFRDMTGTWSVQSRYVELIVDGEYKGIYVFMDKITNNANRVNITDEDGFIVKFDKTDLVDRYEGSGDKKTFKSLYSGKDGSGTYDTQIDQRFEIEYPEMEDVEEEEAGKWAKTVNKIKSMFNNFETQLKAGNYAEVQKIIDYNSWADWFIITEFAKNMDAYRASNLFVYNGDKIEARPLWDQELSFKNYCATLCDDYSCDNAEGLLIRTSKIYDEGESCSAPFWFTGKYVSGRGTEAIGGSQQFAGYLLNDPCFVQTIKDRWNEHKAKALSAESLNAKLERYTNEMATALDREKSIWKSEGGKLSRETCQCSYNGTTGYSDIKISDSKDDITEWISARPAELDKALLDEVGTGLSISFSEENINTTPWEPVILQVHNESGYDYVLTYTDNALDQLTGVIIEKNGDTYKYNIPRPANWGTGDEATEGERANIVYGLKATLQMDSSNVVCGSQAEVPFDEATITLQDEPNEDCVQP